MPLPELQSAIGDSARIDIQDEFFKNYFKTHINAITGQQKWTTLINKIELTTDNDEFVGRYQEVIVHFTLLPTALSDWRKFTFNYDAIVHQVVTHKILVFVKLDWRNGIHEESEALMLGVIKVDTRSGKLFPLQVNLEKGSWWKGFVSMLNLGRQHIQEGTDHLLFLIVLLLPAMLLPNGRQWGSFGGVKYSVMHLLKIVTAFTIGHSLTLLIGAMGWVHLPAQPIEVLIAFSILVSAIHAIYPVFVGKEMYIALGFGLIHGLAFASVLFNMNLGAGTLALSILGFNLGIELMQLLIIALIVPWLILLSRTKMYKPVRIVGAVISSVAAIVWIVERVNSLTN